MNVVFDTNVVVEAIFWPRSNARRALSGLARRRFCLIVNAEIIQEYRDITEEIRKRLFPQAQPAAALAWIISKSLVYAPAPLGKLSRDPDDDLFVATALAAAAKFVVSQDRDLLVLKKPFGIEIVTPIQLVRRLHL